MWLLTNMLNQIKEQQARIAELEKDKARLDWMIARQRIDREYIDAAMKLEPK